MIRTFLHNVKYFLTHRIEEEISCLAVEKVEDLLAAGMIGTADERIDVLDDDASWEAVLNRNRSFVRIGDGELAIIDGKSIAFQRADTKLAAELAEILQSDRIDLFTGVDYNCFNGFRGVPRRMKYHNYLYGIQIKNTLLQYCNPRRQYISASFNQPYISHENIDRSSYQERVESLFRDRNVVVFAGDGILDKLRYNIFSLASTVEYVPCPSRDAYSEYPEILSCCRTFSKDKVLCFILGPTSKPLVYHLSEEGYTAWDIGHMAKDYDACMRNLEKSWKNINGFFAPD